MKHKIQPGGRKTLYFFSLSINVFAYRYNYIYRIRWNAVFFARIGISARYLLFLPYIYYVFYSHYLSHNSLIYFFSFCHFSTKMYFFWKMKKKTYSMTISKCVFSAPWMNRLLFLIIHDSFDEILLKRLILYFFAIFFCTQIKMKIKWAICIHWKWNNKSTVETTNHKHFGFSDKYTCLDVFQQHMNRLKPFIFTTAATVHGLCGLVWLVQIIMCFGFFYELCYGCVWAYSQLHTCNTNFKCMAMMKRHEIPCGRFVMCCCL